jgi:hypothetical protein
MPDVSAEAPMTDPIDRAPFYHGGMRELQDRFDGRRVADRLEKHRFHFEFWEQERKRLEPAANANAAAPASSPQSLDPVH